MEEARRLYWVTNLDGWSAYLWLTDTEAEDKEGYYSKVVPKFDREDDPTIRCDEWR